MLGLPLPDLLEEENAEEFERFLLGSDPKPDLLTTRTLPTKVPRVKRVCSISAGGMHTAALTVDGKVYTWGVDDEGALGYSLDDDENPIPQIVPQLDEIIQVTSGESFTLFLNTKGQVLMCGKMRSFHYDSFHYPSDGVACQGNTVQPVVVPMPGNEKAVSIAAGNGSNFAAVLLKSGVIGTFGFGEHGE
ncbi:hypothetical protein FisN_2Lu558 [Fistulifera solaris]|uniref:Regulator of chromosome condensation n=1 Tax=Fistulifera solaris TaxID=1519565 RepID=A0A1Z5JAN6_FISSO|nr:hypothetical protein FisN_2Lu558 [Fistulifera solaris]|eukprot:GAX11029.1 hypothetical protein FisN_2Lu558 [Fistulifera solaris]